MWGIYQVFGGEVLDFIYFCGDFCRVFGGFGRFWLGGKFLNCIKYSKLFLQKIDNL